MKQQDKMIATGLTVLMLVVWLGFLFHQSERFAGSLWGGVLGVTGGVLMLFPLIYLIIKRVAWLKKRITRKVPMRTLLTWHIYAGLLGPILVLVHTGHKFESLLGILLTALTIVVVLSGFVGRYLMNGFTQTIREKKGQLDTLHLAYARAHEHVIAHANTATLIRPFSGMISRVIGRFLIKDNDPIASGIAHPATLLRLSESIADLEYTIKIHEQCKTWFSKWLKLHTVLSYALYVLLALHIWASIHFGLRWSEAWAPTTLDGRVTNVFSPDAPEVFARHFGAAFGQYWRSSHMINGVNTTVFDYASLAKDARSQASDFAKALNVLKHVDPDQFETTDQGKAFWLNVYNIGAMKLVAENYPINSITDRKVSLLGNPWGIKSVTVGHKRYSLRQIEKDILLPMYEDPRIVFAVSCAAVSCPDRPSTIFSSDNLDKQLDDIIRVFMQNKQKGLALSTNGKRLTVSWIFKADRELFGDETAFLEFIGRYAPADIRTVLENAQGPVEITYSKHDWTLNDIAQAVTRS